MKDDAFMKQVKLFDPTKNKYRLHIIGVGSVGSFLAWNSAKAGYKNITVYDFDKVEETNVPAQLFGLCDVGRLKTESIADRIKNDTGVVITQVVGKIEPSTEMLLTAYDVVVIAVDDLSIRKMLFDKVKKYPNIWVMDMRIGQFNLVHYCINTSNKEDVAYYEKSLEGKQANLLCGEKCCIPVNMVVSSEALMNLFRISLQKTPVRYIYRKMDVPEMDSIVDDDNFIIVG